MIQTRQIKLLGGKEFTFSVLGCTPEADRLLEIFPKVFGGDDAPESEAETQALHKEMETLFRDCMTQSLILGEHSPEEAAAAFARLPVKTSPKFGGLVLEILSAMLDLESAVEAALEAESQAPKYKAKKVQK